MHLLLFWKNFTDVGDRQEVAYTSFEDGGRNAEYHETQTRDPLVSYTVITPKSGVQYQHRDER